MTEFTLQALHDEIEADLEALGYKEDGDWKDDQLIADLGNAKNLVIDNFSVSMEQVRATVTYDAYNALAVDEQEWIRWMTPNSGQFQVTADMKTQLTGRSPASGGVAGMGDDADSFWATSHRATMAPALLAIIEVPGSRFEVLWGEGTRITAGNVGHSANL